MLLMVLLVVFFNGSMGVLEEIEFNWNIIFFVFIYVVEVFDLLVFDNIIYGVDDVNEMSYDLSLDLLFNSVYFW